MKKKLFSREVKIGIYGICMILLLYLGINFIKSQDIFSRENSYYAVYDNSYGIEASSPVTVKGLRVGTVDRVRYDVPTGKIVVEFSVKRAYPVPADSKAKIASASLLGATVLDLQLGSEQRILESGDTVPALTEPRLMEAAGELKDKANDLLADVSQALEGVNAILSAENVEHLSGVLANAHSISASVNRIVAEELNGTMQNLHALSAELNTARPKIARIVERMETIADSLSVSVPILLADAIQTIDKLNKTMTAVNDAEGSVGKLIYDKALYDNLTEASQNLALLFQDIKEHPGRYVHFSIFGGRKRE